MKDYLYWQTVQTETLGEFEVFQVRQTLAESKCVKQKQARFHTIVCCPWVNIIAITRDGEVVLVEQYRHGIRDLTVEIPGGCIDEEDEEPLQAAIRELREETGYVCQNWSLLGVNHPNPALQDNLCYTFLAEQAEKIEEPSFDGTGTERIKTSTVSITRLSSMIRSGQITHSLVITAFHYLMLKRPEYFQKLSFEDCN